MSDASISSKQITVAEISESAVKADGQWIPFEDRFYHGCCDCGLSHAVEIRREGDGHEVLFKFDRELTETTRKSNRHPLWDEIKRLRAELERLRPMAESWESYEAAQDRKSSAVETTDEPSPLQTERDVYCLALSQLVRTLDAVHNDPRYKAVWESYMIHGGRYTEPTYTVELESARKLLSYYGLPDKPRERARLPPDEFMLDDARDILIKSNLRVAGNEEFILRLMKAYTRPVETKELSPSEAASFAKTLARSPRRLRDSDAAFNLGVLPTEQPEKASGECCPFRRIVEGTLKRCEKPKGHGDLHMVSRFGQGPYMWREESGEDTSHERAGVYRNGDPI